MDTEKSLSAFPKLFVKKVVSSGLSPGLCCLGAARGRQKSKGTVMRYVTVSTALALSIAAFSSSIPASAEQDDKIPVVYSFSSQSSAPTKVRVAQHAVMTQESVRPRNASAHNKPAVRQNRQQPSETKPAVRFPRMFASADPVSEARRWIGTNPTDRNSLWCARFMNFVLERSGYEGTGSDAAKSFASYGRRVSGPQVGAIAVMTRGKNGGHVGIVSGFDSAGNPVIISGNSRGRLVAEHAYPRNRIYAYVLPR
jgi:uncharacterized protein (TIGR02594 family)